MTSTTIQTDYWYEEERSEKKPMKAIAPVTLGLFENVNIKAVTDAEKQKREKQKEDNLKKKEKDKVCCIQELERKKLIYMLCHRYSCNGNFVS